MCRVNHEAYSLGLDIGGKAIRSAKAAAANRAAQFCRSSGASRKRGDGRDRQGGEGAGKACCFRRSAKDEDFGSDAGKNVSLAVRNDNLDFDWRAAQGFERRLPCFKRDRPCNVDAD